MRVIRLLAGAGGTVLAVSLASAPAAADAPALNVLSHNVFFLPTSLYPNWGQSTRADLIAGASYVDGRDVVVLQEMFDNAASDKLQGRLAGRYPHQTPVLGRSRTGWDATLGRYSDSTPEDGGVTILSKWPIVEKVQYVYADGCGADWFSNKGFVYAKLNVNGTFVHVVGTHAQAEDTGCTDGTGAQVRAAQFDEMDAFLDNKRIPSSEAVIIAGDLNVDRYSPEYADTLNRLGVADPHWTGHPYSWDAHTNAIADYNDGKNLRQQLDYVLLRQANAQIPGWTNDTLPAKSPTWSVWSWFTKYTYNDFSDHYPVVGR